MKIEIKDLEKVFRTDTVETVALNKVSFTIGDGGKSTLLNILGLLDNPTAGSYRLDGKEVGGLRESERTEWRKGRIGFVFQSFNLIEEMTVRDNIMLPLNNLKLDKAEKRRRVDEALRRMGISHRAGHYPSQLSADEPTGNLDSRNGAEVMDLLRDLHRDGATIVMVTHSQRDAAQADYIINLFDGQVVENLNDKL